MSFVPVQWNSLFGASHPPRWFWGSLLPAHWFRRSRTVAGHVSSLSGKVWLGPWCPCKGLTYSAVSRHEFQPRSLAVRRLVELPGGDWSRKFAVLRNTMGL